MTEKQAISEFKKIDSITRKLSRNGYNVDLVECVLVLSTNEQHEKTIERMDKIHSESKEWGLSADENLYTITF